MRVIHIITGLDDGGAEGVLYRLVQASPHEHTVISLTSEAKYGPLLRARGIEVETLEERRGRFSLGSFQRLTGIIRRVRPDVVQTWMYHADLVGGIAARYAGVKRVYWNIRNSDLSARRTARSTRLTMRLCALLSRYVPRRIACCAHAAADLHRSLGYATDRFVIIPNGIDADRFRPSPDDTNRWRTALGLESSTPVIGMIARFHPQKDHAGLLDAFRSVVDAIHDAKCVLVGIGVTPENTDLVDEIAARGLSDHVILAGPTNEVPGVLNALDVHVLSSAFGEAFPNVVAEAMACGTPCVVTDVGDAARIVGRHGWVVPPFDSAALARAIIAALEERHDLAAWQRRRDESRQHIVETYTMNAMVNAYDQLWRQ